jgi:hypothetical protein
VRSCNARPKSSSFPDVGTRAHEIISVGEAFEQKNTSAEAEGKWKKFPRKRYFRKIAATVRSCNARVQSTLCSYLVPCSDGFFVYAIPVAFYVDDFVVVVAYWPPPSQ